MLQDRVSSAMGFLARCEIDALLLLNLSNIRYLSGFTGSDGALLLFRDDGFFLTDSRYSTQASDEVPHFRKIIYQEKLLGISSALREKGATRLGFEADHVTIAFHKALSDVITGTDLIPIGPELNNLRVIKDAGEVALMAGTAELASQCLLRLLPKIKPGVTEHDVALELEFEMRKAGADDKAFDIIVASGERGALPHGKASSKTINAGELVTIDFGAVCQGYHSDETVTVAVGEPDRKQQEIHKIVKDAHDFALDAVKPGISYKELDGKARDYIDRKGFGKYFGHGLGHGVGIEIHEKPVLSPRSEGVVEEGMVFTIEPGIYIPGWGGVRIEDTVCVTKDSCSTLTKAPKDLMIM